jgi:lipopolysaccharide transport protein LptA
MAPPWSVHRIRPAVMAAIGIVLVATLGAYYARRRVRPPEPAAPKPIAQDIGQQTRAFSLSKTVGEHTLYIIHAEQVTNYEDTGKAQLRGVLVTLFGKDGSRHDTITSPECIYDPTAQSIWVPGDVAMRFDVPKSEAGGAAGAPASKAPVEVFTSQLTFEQGSGVASTDAPVRFLFAEGEGVSQGASYDPQQQALLLKSDVQLTLKPATGASTSGGVTKVRADSAQFYREQGRVVFNNSLEVVRDTRRIRASHGELDLDPSFHVRQARLSGDVTASDDTPTDLLQVAAQQATVDFSEAGRMQTINLAQKVTWNLRSRSQNGVKEGAAQHVRLQFRNPERPDSDERLDRVIADGGVRMRFESAPSAATSRVAASSSETQTIAGDHAELTMAPSGKTLGGARVSGSPRLELEPGRPDADRRTVTANEFLITMDDRGELNQFRAEGSVRVASDVVNADVANVPQRHRESASDFLEAFFADSSRTTLDRIRQWGHFEYRDTERQARAAEANSVISEQTVVLHGTPAVWNPDGKLTANAITLETGTGALGAEGSVSSTFFRKPSASDPQPEPIHVVSDRLRYNPSNKRSHFDGHARLWQGESFLLEAAALDWSAAASELTASGKVYSVYREQAPERTKERTPGLTKEQTPEQTKDPLANRTAAPPSGGVIITANTFQYQQQKRLAHYEGDVRMKKDSGTMAASELDVFLSGPASKDAVELSLNAGQIERAEARRSVKITEGARIATGDRAEYLPSNNQVRLYGALAKVADPSRGTVEGAELTYFLGGDRIQVQGSPGSPTETRWQLHP